MALHRAAVGDHPWFYLLEHADWLEGFLAWRQGDVMTGLDTMRRAVPRLCTTKARFPAAFVLVDLAELAAEAEAADVAAEAAALLSDCAAALGYDMYLALAAIAHAWAHIAEGLVDDAAAVACDAVEILRPLGYRAFLARALAVLGRSLGEADPSAAATARAEAAELFDVSGASWRRDRALGLPDGTRGVRS